MGPMGLGPGPGLSRHRGAGGGGCAPVPAAPDDYKTRELVTASRALTGEAERAPGCGGAGRVCPCQQHPPRIPALQHPCPADPCASLPRCIPRTSLRTHVLPALRAAPAPGGGGLAPSGSAGHGHGSPGPGVAVPDCPCPAPAPAVLRVLRASPRRGQAGGSPRHPRTPPRRRGSQAAGLSPGVLPAAGSQAPVAAREPGGGGRWERRGGPPLLAARGSTGPPPPLRSFCLPGPGGSAAASGAARPRCRCRGA